MSTNTSASTEDHEEFGRCIRLSACRVIGKYRITHSVVIHPQHRTLLLTDSDAEDARRWFASRTDEEFESWVPSDPISA